MGSPSGKVCISDCLWACPWVQNKDKWGYISVMGGETIGEKLGPVLVAVSLGMFSCVVVLEGKEGEERIKCFFEILDVNRQVSLLRLFSLHSCWSLND